MIGTAISHYSLRKKLGSGGMGEVYEAEDLKLQRRVALKFLPENLAHDPHALERFQREALALSALNHPNICTIHAIDESGGTPFIAMELLEGRPLHQLIGSKPLSLDTVLALGVEIADALEAAHGHGIIHRDIKPSNIFVTRRKQAKILDFGLAKLLSRQLSMSEGMAGDVTVSTLASAELMTTPGGVAGTIAYMSPEQARGADLDPRTDLFSLGIVLYEMATGTLPFKGESPAVIFDAILNREPISILKMNPDLPPQLAAIISKALEKDRDLRYQSAADMRADLQRLRLETASTRQASSKTQAASPPHLRRPRLATWLVVVAAVFTLGGSVAYLYWPHHRAPLTDNDVIVVADFTNRTGDPVFDDTLKEALATDLGQSPFFNLLPERRARETLRFMGRPTDARIIDELAREVCVRNNGKVAIEGTLGQLGSQYVLGLSALNCNTGDVIAREKQTAGRKEEVLKALERADTSLRKKLGESLASIQKFDAPLEQISTPSLEAYQDVARGRRAFAAKGEEEIPFYQHAVKVDPEFALALSWLGAMYFTLGNRDQGREYTARAYQFRGRASDRERFKSMQLRILCYRRLSQGD